MQMNNSDIFIRPSASQTDQWTDVPAIASITVRTAAPQSSTTQMNSAVQFSDAIYDKQIVCFAAGTFILTDAGEVMVKDLAIGDMIWTKDNGFQPIRWIGRTKLDAGRLNANPRLRPIRIAAGALGHGVPICMSRLLFAIENMAWLAEVAHMYSACRVGSRAVTTMGLRTHLGLISGQVAEDHLVSQALGT